MVTGRHCNYSLTKPTNEQFESFMWHTGVHIVVAGTVNGVALYLIGIEDVLPGILIGGAAGLSANFTHKVVHLIGVEDRNGCHLPIGIDLVLAAVLTYGISRGLLKVFEYKMGKWEIIKLNASAMSAIAVANKYQKDSGKG